MASRYTLDERIAQQRALLDELTAKQAKERRKRDTRRKAVVGATILSRVRGDEAQLRRLVQTLDAHCTRPSDRAFLGLPPERPGAEGRAEGSLDAGEVARRLLED